MGGERERASREVSFSPAVGAQGHGPGGPVSVGDGGTEGVEPGRGRHHHSTLIQYLVTERSPCSWQHAGDHSHENK